FLLGILCLSFALSRQAKGGAIPAGMVGLLLIGAGVAFVVVTIKDFLYPITGVGLYNSGIRWQCGKHKYTALWSDIEAVWRQDTVIYVNGQKKGEVHTLTLTLYAGQSLFFSCENLTHYDTFVERVQSAHGGYMLRTKQRELAERGEAEF